MIFATRRDVDYRACLASTRFVMVNEPPVRALVSEISLGDLTIIARSMGVPKATLELG